MIDPQEGGAAIIRREESREADGKFGIQNHAAPITVIAGGVVSEYVDPKRGSFRYPEGTGFDGSAQDHLDFFLKVPIPETLVQAADEAYEQRRIQEIEWAGNRAAAKVQDDPESVELVTRANRESATGRATYNRLVDEARERGEQEEAARWPRKAIANPEVRLILRAAQAYYMRGLIDDPEQRALVENHRIKFSGGTPTIKQVWERYRCDRWLPEVV